MNNIFVAFGDCEAFCKTILHFYKAIHFLFRIRLNEKIEDK